MHWTFNDSSAERKLITSAHITFGRRLGDLVLLNGQEENEMAYRAQSILSATKGHTEPPWQLHWILEILLGISLINSLYLLIKKKKDLSFRVVIRLHQNWEEGTAISHILPAPMNAETLPLLTSSTKVILSLQLVNLQQQVTITQSAYFPAVFTPGFVQSTDFIC